MKKEYIIYGIIGIVIYYMFFEKTLSGPNSAQAAVKASSNQNQDA